MVCSQGRKPGSCYTEFLVQYKTIKLSVQLHCNFMDLTNGLARTERPLVHEKPASQFVKMITAREICDLPIAPEKMR